LADVINQSGLTDMLAAVINENNDISGEGIQSTPTNLSLNVPETPDAILCVPETPEGNKCLLIELFFLTVSILFSIHIINTVANYIHYLFTHTQPRPKKDEPPPIL
jgi:hypothetical protein